MAAVRLPKALYDRGESKGSSCYRLLSRTGQFIYLRTHGFLEIDSTGTVESFVCVNTLVSEKDGLQLIREMKRKYSALIETAISDQVENGNSGISTESVEDPQQLEAAIVQLITNLPSPESENRSTPSPHFVSTSENQDCTTLLNRQSQSPVASLSRRNKTVSKRPPSTDLNATLHKRHKDSSNYTLIQSPQPYHRPKITEISHEEQPLYQPDHLLTHKIKEENVGYI